MITKEGQRLLRMGGMIYWMLALIRAFASEANWFNAIQHFFFGSFLLLLSFQSAGVISERYKMLPWASLGLSIIFTVLHLIN